MTTPPKTAEERADTAILTDDAFKVSRELLKTRYENDKKLKASLKAIERRREIMRKGSLKYQKALSAYRVRQGRYINRIYCNMAKRRKQIRNLEKLKLIRKAAQEFQRRVRKEGLTAQ
jgi:hypothetical protein